MENKLLTSNEIKEYVDIIIKLKKKKNIIESKTKMDFNDYMKLNFNCFINEYPTLYEMILQHDDLDYLYQMLDMKKKIENGGNQDNIEKELGEILANEYIYPLVNK